MTFPNKLDGAVMTDEQINTIALRRIAGGDWADDCMLPKATVVRIADELDSLRAAAPKSFLKERAQLEQEWSVLRRLQAQYAAPSSKPDGLSKMQRIAIEAALSISRDISDECHDGSFLSDASVQALRELLAAPQPFQPAQAAEACDHDYINGQCKKCGCVSAGE